MIVNLEDFEDVEEGFGDWEVIDGGDWVSGGKWEYLTGISKNKVTGKYYRYELSRSGSYYTEYYYNHREEGFVNLVEVIPVERTVIVKDWEEV
ncbi:MAG: hypothetical protein KBT03_00315 [Bacteroidales bacterium]|nr:hypothetical protein [Candidatus Scybalousia scybalohippi]